MNTIALGLMSHVPGGITDTESLVLATELHLVSNADLRFTSRACSSLHESVDSHLPYGLRKRNGKPNQGPGPMEICCSTSSTSSTSSETPRVLTRRGLSPCRLRQKTFGRRPFMNTLAHDTPAIPSLSSNGRFFPSLLAEPLGQHRFRSSRLRARFCLCLWLWLCPCLFIYLHCCESSSARSLGSSA